MTLRTELEAATTTCWRTIGTNAVGTCIASQCMAWQWRGHRDRHDPKIRDTFMDIREGENDHDLVAVGYCGPAGEPR